MRRIICIFPKAQRRREADEIPICVKNREQAGGKIPLFPKMAADGERC